jgi:aminopeptidase N
MRKILSLLLVAYALQLNAQKVDVLHYRFNIVLNDKNDIIDGVAAVTFVQQSQWPAVVFDLSSVNKQGRGISTKAVSDDSKIAHKLSFSQQENKLIVNTPHLRHGDTMTIYVTYQGIPADGLIISKNKHGDRTFFADNWPNRAHHWIPCIDQPNDKASFEFIVTAPSHYSVISNGLKVKEEEIGNSRKRTHWREDTPQPTKVMVIGVARFATKTYDNSPPNIPVSAWVYPQDSTKGFYDYALAPDILKFFSDYIAPFPYKKLANVQSKTIFGGMENASAIFYAENSVTGDRSSEDLLAHEIAHQWFGDMASEKSFAHLWLSEGFATFLTNYYWEKKYGKEAAAKRWKGDREQVIAFAKQNPRPVVDSTTNLMSLLNANSYQKGAWVLRMLQAEVGDSIFQKIIQTYYSQYKGGNAETRDFEAVAEQVSDKELTWFFDQWLYRSGIPKLEIRTRKDGLATTIVIVQQQRDLFRLNVVVGLRNKSDESHKVLPIVITERETEIKVPRGYTKIYIDPFNLILFEGKDEFTITTKSR